MEPGKAENVRYESPTDEITTVGFQRTAGVEQSPSQVPALPPPYPSPAIKSTWPAFTAADAFGTHFFRCFFCRIGDNRIEDHFCETGRELIVAMLDELDGRP
jgi:hypothetical protein